MNKVYIIAEIGINHEGIFDDCIRLIDEAINAGANAVKLQTIDPDKNYVKESPSYKLFKKSQLTKSQTKKIFRYAQKKNIDVFTTCGDVETANWVNKLNPSAWKISSGLLNHLEIIKHIANFKRKMIISTGMAHLDDVKKAISVIKSTGNNDIVILQCTSEYPTKKENVNLKNIKYFKKKFKLAVGYSDHSLGHEAAFLSVAAGAKYIEKHITLNKRRKDYDHRISLEGYEFKKFVNKIRLAEILIGNMEYGVSKNLNKVRSNFLRTIVSLKKIKINEKFTKKNIGVKRPTLSKIGLEPAQINNFYGKKSNRNIKKDDIV